MAIRKLAKRLLIAAGLCGLIGGGLIVTAPAQPAHAWSLDPHVTMTGKIVGCSTSGPLQQATVRANLNGQIHQWTTGLYSSQPSYTINWTNVPGGRGGWAFITVHCSAVTPDYNLWVRVYRPGWGWTMPTVNL
jgi:hypothetical protein